MCVCFNAQKFERSPCARGCKLVARAVNVLEKYRERERERERERGAMARLFFERMYRYRGSNAAATAIIT